MIAMIQKIIQYRDLLTMLTLRDLKVRYKQAAMGFLWAIFMPIIAVFAGLLIKKAMAVVSQKPLEMTGVFSLIIKVLPWTFFVSSIRFAVQSLVGNSSLVSKIYFPKAILPLSSTLACLFDMMIATIVAIIILTTGQVGLSIQVLWVPYLLLLLFIFTFGLGLILSAANLFFRDVKYIVEIILMFGIFFTPVFYSADAFGRLKPLMLINPIGSILQQLDSVVVKHQPPEWFWLGYATIMSIFVLFLGLYIFNKKESEFAENI